MNNPSFNRLSSAQAERLALLAEELGETVQAIGKILRHGYASKNPTHGVLGDDNRKSLERELGDVAAAVQIMVRAGDIEEPKIRQAAMNKLTRVEIYLHHQNNEA